MIGFLIALGNAASGSLFVPPAHLPSRAEAQSAVVRCGLPAKSVSVLFDRGMDEDVIWVSRPSGALTGPALRCIARASLKTTYYVYFRDHALQARYDKLYFGLENAADVARGRDWLRAHNHLVGLPLPRKGAPLSNYAQAVEAFCGVKQGTLLAATDEHFITFTKEGLGQITQHGLEHAAANEAQFECVMSATSAADLKSRGIGFGLVTHPSEAPH